MMRVIVGILVTVLATSTVGLAQQRGLFGQPYPEAQRNTPPKESMTGYLVDRRCAKHATSLKDVGPNHSIQCPLRAERPEMGLVTNGVWIAFDERGSKKAIDVLKKAKTNQNMVVTVTGNRKGNLFAVSGIKTEKD